MNNYDDIPDGDDIFFTVINPDDQSEDRIDISYRKTGAGGSMSINGLEISPQQASELGMLLFGIAAKLEPVDTSSGAELLDGFKIPVPLKELQEIVTDEIEERRRS